MHPELRFNYLDNERDRREVIEGVRMAREILNQPAFEPFSAGELSPGPGVETDAEILDWFAKDAETSYHPCGTCRLGVGEDAVVDPATMTVHGLEGVRVVDASLFPTIPNANLFAPVMMVAEKAADHIMGNTRLAAEDFPSFRHDPRIADATTSPAAATS
jgi:choline dehydrogenase